VTRTGANATGSTGDPDRAFLPTRATQRWTRTSCSPCRRANAAGVSPLARSAATISSPSASCHRARPRGGVHSAGAVTTRGPLLRSVVVSAISASWLATLTETRARYQTSTTGRLPWYDLAETAWHTLDGTQLNMTALQGFLDAARDGQFDQLRATLPH
jgi:hypothetical protein